MTGYVRSWSLQPNSDQHVISPCNISASLNKKVMRIKEMIAKYKLLESQAYHPELRTLKI